ncbi:MAG: hypothetical protein AAF203_10050 [Pseudomonadota bacterium]
MNILRNCDLIMKNLLNSFIVFCMLTATLPSQAANYSNYEVVGQLNYDTSLEGSARHLKSLFQTNEDKRQIDAKVDQLKNKVKRWKWRHETIPGRGFALRVNGKTQMAISDINYEAQSFKVNGSLVTINRGESFLSALGKVERAYKPKRRSASFDFLFVNEAEAIVPFIVGIFGFLGLAGVAHAVESNRGRSPKEKCLANIRVNDPDVKKFRFPPAHLKFITTLENSSRVVDNAKFPGSSHCSWRKMPYDADERLRMIAENFDKGGRFHM